MAWRSEGRVHVVVHAAAAPQRGEWEEYVRDLKRTPSGPMHRVLVRSYGGSPNGSQRKQLTDMEHHRQFPAAVLTNSVLARTAGTALSWFIPALKVFGIGAFDAACDHLELTPDERVRARTALRDLERELGVK